MLQRDGNRRSNMERANEPAIELTTKELDAVTGGKAIPPRTTLPTNPFSPPSIPKKVI
jgi:bacteriocin-like protein